MVQIGHLAAQMDALAEGIPIVVFLSLLEVCSLSYRVECNYLHLMSALEREVIPEYLWTACVFLNTQSSQITQSSGFSEE